ncbi:MAG TPA: LysR family transcriptional regulator [Stellaceae bacterium]|jgi:DNA-binding transcriptional LysR family regulator|nr:LysR family transcriptional regulator [Stellaceae bacterium]
MRNLSLDQLDTFAAIVELGSFSAAARRLNLTQPAVSFQMRQLERRFGLRLIERVGRHMRPTIAGSELLPHVRRIDDAVAAAIAAIGPYAEGATGRVRIGTGATACIYLLPPVLRDLRRRFPELELIVSTGNSPEILAALENNALDVALVTLPASGRSFACETIVDDEIVAVFPPGAEPPYPVAATELATRPVMLYEPGGNSRRVIDDWFRYAGASLKPAMELGSIEAIKQLIAAGLGCGLLPRLAVANLQPADELAIRSLSPQLYRQLGLILRRDKIPDRALREVIAALRRLGSAGV